MRYDETYDPNAPEGESPKSSAYVQKKDIKVVAIALVCLSVMMYPIFRILVRRSEKARCIGNMHAVFAAINEYAIQNEDKFPPIFDSGAADEPVLESSGAPLTWASDLQEYMNPRNSFRCPSADPQELWRSQDVHAEAKSFPVSYGMFAPMSAFNRSLVEDPDEAALIAETSNLGADNTYDPLPFKDPSGKTMPYDGMAVGWDNDNFDGSEKTKLVTRLAFPGSGSGVFEKPGEGRHDEGTFVLAASGHLRTIKPNAAHVSRRYGKLVGMWPMPLTAARHPK